MNAEGGPAAAGPAAYDAEGGSYGYAEGGAAAPAPPVAEQQFAAEGGGTAGPGAAAGGGAEGGAAADEAAAAADGAAAYSPAEYLGQLEAHFAGLQQQRQGLQQQLAAAAAGAYQQMSAALGATSTGVPLPADLPALAGELVVLQGVRHYLAYVQVGRMARACSFSLASVWLAGWCALVLCRWCGLLRKARLAGSWRIVHTTGCPQMVPRAALRVQELQALVRHLDKSVRALQQQAAAGAAAGSAEAAALLQALGEAVDGFSNAVGYAIAVQQLTGGW